MTRRRNPFDEIERMFDRMSDQFEDVGSVKEIDAGPISVDVSEDDEAVTVTADLPGYDRDDIELAVRDGRLTIRAEREAETEQEDETYHRRERTHREVTRTLRLPADVEEENASATYQNGVLTVTLPKAESGPEGTRIDVE